MFFLNLLVVIMATWKTLFEESCIAEQIKQCINESQIPFEKISSVFSSKEILKCLYQYDPFRHIDAEILDQFISVVIVCTSTKKTNKNITTKNKKTKEIQL